MLEAGYGRGIDQREAMSAFQTALGMYQIALESRLPGAEKMASAIARDLFSYSGLGKAIPDSAYTDLETAVLSRIDRYGDLDRRMRDDMPTAGKRYIGYN